MGTTPCTETKILYAFNNAPRCGARTRFDTPCKSPAIRFKRRCRMHGGKGNGAPRGNKNAQKHGFYSKEVHDLLHEAKITLKTHSFSPLRKN